MNVEIPTSWEAAFETFFAEFAPYFQRSESCESARWYVRGLLGEVKRKNSWQLAERVGLADPHPLQRLLNEALWDADAVCQQMRQQVIQHLGYAPGIGVIDESGFIKKGDQSAGVSRQYCGRVGKVENCQVGVFLGYVAPQGAAFLDRQLYLPQEWCEDRARCRAAHIPKAISFQTKPQLAQHMLSQAWAENLPLEWVTADTTYGNSPGFREFIDHQGHLYVLAIATHHDIITVTDGQRISLKHLPIQLESQRGDTLAFRFGEKGLIWYEWLRIRVRMPHDTISDQWLLIRRTTDPPAAYTFYLSNAPLDTPLAELAAVANARHTIEALIEEAKSEVGLADYEVRHWHGWYRHITLTLLAHTWLKLIQHQQREKSPLPTWLSFGVAELRCLLNIVMPLPTLAPEFRLRWFWRRREQRLRAIASRYQLDVQPFLQWALPP